MSALCSASVLQMARGGPPKVPKPYAQYKEEKRQSQSNNSSPSLPRHEDDGPDGQRVEGKLISLTPPSTRTSFGDSGAELSPTAQRLDSLDSTSTSSISSFTNHEGDQDPITKTADGRLPTHDNIPPIPPPRPRRKKTPSHPLDMSPTMSSQVISNPMAAKEKSLTLNSRPSMRIKKQQSLSFSSSIAEALIDIDPLMADCLQGKAAQHSYTPAVLDLANLPTPLEPTRSCTPSSRIGWSSTDMPTSTSGQSTSEADGVRLQQERKRSNAMQTVYRGTSPKEVRRGFLDSKERDPFAELVLMQTNSQWPQKGTVGQGGPPT